MEECMHGILSGRFAMFKWRLLITRELRDCLPSAVVSTVHSIYVHLNSSSTRATTELVE